MEAINYSELHDRIKKSGLSIMKIADYVGLSREGLYKKLNGENDFKVKEFKHLCDVLGVKVESLLTESEVNEIHYSNSGINGKSNSLNERLNEIWRKTTEKNRAIFEMSNEIFIEVCNGMPVEKLFKELHKSKIDENAKEALGVRLAEYLEWRESKNDRRRC